MSSSWRAHLKRWTWSARSAPPSDASRRRLHQEAFRVRAIEAYQTRCAFCRLRHQELLDAAHITADSEVTGEPVVSIGLSRCKLHHAAFDRHFLTVRRDYVIEVRQSILDEEDGPMLLHGLKGMHERPIYLPREVSLSARSRPPRRTIRGIPQHG